MKYFQSPFLQILMTIFQEQLKSGDIRPVFKTLEITKRITDQLVFSLTSLRYMKDFCTINCKHSMSLSYLHISVDLEKILVY